MYPRQRLFAYQPCAPLGVYLLSSTNKIFNQGAVERQQTRNHQEDTVPVLQPAKKGQTTMKDDERQKTSTIDIKCIHNIITNISMNLQINKNGRGREAVVYRR